MKKITADSVMRVVDIYHAKITPASLKIIEDSEPVYRDQILKEDIYDIEGITEDYKGLPEDADPKVLAELEQIGALAAKKKAGYIRIIYS